jgi:protein-serine/threonine kinase
VETLTEEKIGPNSFIVHGMIGKGSFGEVYLVEKRHSSQLLAMKVLHKSKIMCKCNSKLSVE